MNTVATVRDIMQDAPLKIDPDMPVHKAIDKLVAKKLSGVPVIDATGRLVGFLTEKDCLRHQATAHQYNTTGSVVRDVMSHTKQALNPQLDLLAAASRFLECNFATLPVVHGEKLVGSVSRQDMLSAMQAQFVERGVGLQQEKAAQRMVDNPASIDQLQALVGRSSNAQLASVLRQRHAGS